MLQSAKKKDLLNNISKLRLHWKPPEFIVNREQTKAVDV